MDKDERRLRLVGSNYPDRVRIGGQIWRIDFRSRLDDGMLADNTYGYTLEANNLIVVDRDNAFGKIQATVIHEILHACRMTLDNTARPGKKADYAEWEHHFIGLFEPALLQIIKDNPELVSWLQTN